MYSFEHFAKLNNTHRSCGLLRSFYQGLSHTAIDLCLKALLGTFLMA
jgi:hypothetical protein